MNYRCGSALATIAVSILLCGCATGSQRTAGDPLEPMNRTIYSFNGKVDKYVAKSLLNPPGRATSNKEP